MEFKEFNATTSPFRSDFKRELRNDYRSPKSIGARVYCVIQIAATPVTFVVNTAKRVFMIAAAVSSVVFNTLQVLATFFSRLGGFHNSGIGAANYRESFFNIKQALIVTLDHTASLLISPAALVAEEVRLLVGVINPAWTFTFKRPWESNEDFVDREVVSLAPAMDYAGERID